MRIDDDTWIIIPTYNEGQMIGTVIDALMPYFSRILCVDDGSNDDSAKVARSHGATVISHPINLGQGAALQTGIEWVKTQTLARWIVTFDADGQHDPKDARSMVEYGKENQLGFVLGSRFLERHGKSVPLRRRLALKTVAFISGLFGGLRLSDAHNGLRALSRDAFSHVQLNHNRMAHASEINSQLARTHLPYAEYPVHITYSDYSQAKGQSLLNGVNILVDLMWER